MVEEINYAVVPKNIIPTRNRMFRGYWIGVIDKLSIDNALRFEFNNVKEAQRIRNNLHGCFRQTRLKKLNLDYFLHSTIIRNSDKTRTLFVWKEKLEEGAKEVR